MALRFPEPPTIPGPDPNPRNPLRPPPPLACDCHAHVFGPQHRYPYASTRTYVPPDALPSQYVRMLKTIGCQRAVLVQPSVYGTDNSAMLDALASGVFPFRGVAVIDDNTSDEALDEMHRLGVRGVRLNLATPGRSVSLDQAPRLAARIRPFGWHLQLWTEPGQLADLRAIRDQLSIDLVIDHFGGNHAREGLQAPGFKVLLELLKDGACWVKLSGAYRLSNCPPRFADMAPLAQALVAVAPERVLWGTDWPHTRAPFMPNDGDLPDILCDWIPDETLRTTILVHNPQRLYQFDE